MKFLNRLRVRKLSKKAEDYVRDNYREEAPARPADIHFSSALDPEKLSKIRYSIKHGTSPLSQIKPSERPGQIGSRDSYDSRNINEAMRTFLSDESARGILDVLEENADMSFVDVMLEQINKKHLRDVDVYKAAQVDRRLFSKIVSDRTYKPAKDTCLSLCLAMSLTLEETRDLISRAGYTFSHNSKRDLILEFFFRERIYDIMYVNEVLYRLDQKTLGR